VQPPKLQLNDASLLKSRCFIGGVWRGEGEVDVTDPADGEILAAVPNAGAAETREAIEAAREAFVSWRRLLARERSEVLHRWHKLIIGAKDDLARILTCEQGKPLIEALGEIAYAASFIEWFAEEAKRIEGEIIPSHRRDARLLVIRQPVGVVAAITPWNFPAAMITRKAGAALAAGCAMVIKPAMQTPLTALALAGLAERAGVPPGVLNVVTGDAKPIGEELCANPVVRKLSFTGSTATGKLLLRQCADTVKKVSMELGGNAPFIVFSDADIDAAVEGAMASKYRNSGQTCVCVNRFYVEESVAGVFAEKLAQATAKLELGHGLSGGVSQGPLIDEAAVTKVEAHVSDALGKGARLAAGGRRSERGENFYEPTILLNCTKDMLVSREETFGPVASVFSFASEKEAVEAANDSDVGLAGYFYSRDIGRIWRVAEALECGMVGVNTGLISTEVAPFGGVKESGIGREGSRHGVNDYLELKYICMAGM